MPLLFAFDLQLPDMAKLLVTNGADLQLQAGTNGCALEGHPHLFHISDEINNAETRSCTMLFKAVSMSFWMICSRAELHSTFSITTSANLQVAHMHACMCVLPSHGTVWCREAAIHLAVAMNDIKLAKVLTAHRADLDIEAEKLYG